MNERSRSRRGARIRNAAAGLARRLPPPRDEAALAVLRNLRALSTGRPAQQVPTTHGGTSHQRDRSVPIGPPLPRVDRIETGEWRSPPEVTGVGQVVRSVYETGEAPERFDVALLDALNTEYKDRPIVPKPRSYTPAAMTGDAPGRISWAHNLVDLRRKTVLEIGCGHGFEVWSLANNLGCEAYGVDVRELATWSGLTGDHVHFECTDLSQSNPFPPGKFDRIISYTVWEHVAHPRALLREAYEVLKPGGLAWLHVNLFAGPQASHRYRDIYFPWPHLLFSDDVIRDWDESKGRARIGAAWVNRLTWDHYQRYFVEIGFRIRYLKFVEPAWDESFYRRFEDVLGRYPKSDLGRDYFVVVLEKPMS